MTENSTGCALNRSEVQGSKSIIMSAQDLLPVLISDGAGFQIQY